MVCIFKTITKQKDNKMCDYKKNETKNLPYPRKSYTSECGLDFVMLEGYKFITSKDTANCGIQINTEELNLPSGKCMKCGKDITVTI